MIKLYKSRTHEEIFKKMIPEINSLVEKDEEILIIVPPIFSMTLESLIYEHLQKKVFLNFKVMSLTKFIESCNIGENKESGDIISITVINKVLQKNKEKFKWIKYNDKKTHLPNEFYKIITNFRANLITINSLIKVQNKIKDKALQAKLFDLILVYDEYLKEIKKQYPDLMSLREDFLERLKNNKIDVSNLNVFVIDLDEISKIEEQIYKIIATKCKNFEIGFLHDLKDLENSVYKNEAIINFEKIIKQTKLPYKIEEVRNIKDAKIEFLLDNMFTFSSKKYAALDSTLNMRILQYENLHSEVLGLCKKIADLLLKGYKLSDIEVAVLNLNRYREPLKKFLLTFNIPFLIEERNSLSEHIPFKFVLDVLNLVKHNFDVRIMHSILLSPYSDLPIELVNFYINIIIANDVNVYNSINQDRVKILKGFATEEEIELLQNYFTKFIGTIEKIPKNKAYVKEIVEGVKKVIQDLNLEDISRSYVDKYEDDHVKEAFIISFEKIEEILDNMALIFDDVQMTLESFINIFSKLAENTNISNAPITQDKIFIGDVHSSSFAVNKNVIVLGLDNIAVLESLKPIDTYLFNDRDWAILSKETHNEMNSIKDYLKFVKFKLLEILVKARENLILTYHIKSGVNELRESTVIKEIKNYFGLDEEKIKIDVSEELIVTNQERKIDFSNFILSKDDTIKINASALTEFQTCGLKCFFNKIVHIESCILENRNITIGNMIHELFETLYSTTEIKKILHDKEISDKTELIIKDMAKDILDSMIEKTSKDSFDKDVVEEFDFNKDNITQACVTAVFDDIRSGIEELETEKVFHNIKFKFEDSLFAISGRSDKIGVSTARDILKIVDYKSGKTTFQEQGKGILENTQMELYLLAYLIAEIEDNNIIELDKKTKLSELIEKTNLEKIELEYFHPIKTLKTTKTGNKVVISSTSNIDNESNVIYQNIMAQNKINVLGEIKKYKEKYVEKTLRNLQINNRKNRACQSCEYLDVCYSTLGD